MVTKFKLLVTLDQNLQVMVTNRGKIERTRKCLGLTLLIQDYPIHDNFYVLPVTACQVVLGVQWLATLGLIETDYIESTMSF